MNKTTLIAVFEDGSQQSFNVEHQGTKARLMETQEAAPSGCILIAATAEKAAEMYEEYMNPLIPDEEDEEED